MTLSALWGEFGLAPVVGAAGLLIGVLNLAHSRRLRTAAAREQVRAKQEFQVQLRDCLIQLASVSQQLEKIETGAQTDFALPGAGGFGRTTRSRAMRLLRTGMTADTAAAELGLQKAEVRLLSKINELLVPPADQTAGVGVTLGTRQTTGRL